MPVPSHAVILAALGTLAFPQSPVSPSHAAGYLNQCIAVIGMARIHEDQQRSGMDIDLQEDRVFFRGFIPKGTLNQFPHLTSLEGEAAVITGFVRMVYNRPEMVLFDASQVKRAREAKSASLRCPAAF